MTDRLLSQLRTLHWPAACQDSPPPAAGQLWRIARKGAAGLAVVADTPAPRGRLVAVMAATADCDAGDDLTVAVETANGMRVAVWTALRAKIPASVLDHRLDDLTSASFDTVRAVASGHRPGDWAPISSILDDRTLIRLELQEKTERFASPASRSN
ncbi:MAG: hypothetical protein F4Z31_02220 [Gemmatimonadetes bacterium]|nr:hypothetical protein [Gemmatimonadota bacterium]